MNEIKVVRIYDHEQPAGYRILVDRLWPRGMSKVCLLYTSDAADE